MSNSVTLPPFIFTEDLMIMGELYEMSTDNGSSTIWFIFSYLEYDGFAFVEYYDFVAQKKNKGIFNIKDLSAHIFRRVPLLDLHNTKLMNYLIEIQSCSCNLRKKSPSIYEYMETHSISIEDMYSDLESRVKCAIPRLKKIIPSLLSTNKTVNG